MPDIPTSWEEFEDAVLGIVARWIVGGTVTVIGVFVAAVLDLWDVLISIPGRIIDPIVDKLIWGIATQFLNVIGLIESFALDIVYASGPLAPLWISVITIVVLFAVSFVISTIIRVIPVL